MSRVSKPYEIVERALELSTADGCVVIADESSSANLRWAYNALTTNGVTRGRTLTVIATVDGAEGTASGVVSRSAVTMRRPGTAGAGRRGRRAGRGPGRGRAAAGHRGPGLRRLHGAAGLPRPAPTSSPTSPRPSATPSPGPARAAVSCTASPTTS